MALDNNSSVCDTASQDICSHFESSGAGRWPEARTQTNKRKRSVLLQSALSSTPEFVGQKVWWTWHKSLSQGRKRASQSRTPWIHPGEDSGSTVVTNKRQML